MGNRKDDTNNGLVCNILEFIQGILEFISNILELFD